MEDLTVKDLIKGNPNSNEFFHNELVPQLLSTVSFEPFPLKNELRRYTRLGDEKRANRLSKLEGGIRERISHAQKAIKALHDDLRQIRAIRKHIAKHDGGRGHAHDIISHTTGDRKTDEPPTPDTAVLHDRADDKVQTLPGRRTAPSSPRRPTPIRIEKRRERFLSGPSKVKPRLTPTKFDFEMKFGELAERAVRSGKITGSGVFLNGNTYALELGSTEERLNIGERLAIACSEEWDKLKDDTETLKAIAERFSKSIDIWEDLYDYLFN